jgi:hypothetical protein
VGPVAVCVVYVQAPGLISELNRVLQGQDRSEGIVCQKSPNIVSKEAK